MQETYLSQGFDYLGSLRERLSGLTGFETMALELIQNAEDAGASIISFDFRDDRLIIENDSEFTTCRKLEEQNCPEIKNKSEQLVTCDFHRMRLLAGGHKRYDEDAIGTFGIGFISVYHFTDRPQIISKGIDWTFFPDRKESERILQKEVILIPGRTKFILPWAFDSSSILRKKLELSGVEKEDIAVFQKQLSKMIVDVLIFLKNLNAITVLRNGIESLKINCERHPDKGEVHIKLNDSTILWKTYKSNISDPGIIQLNSKKKTEVTLAIRENVDDFEGKIFSFLPTNIGTGFPFHINADFYPTPERKGVILDGNDSRVSWNREAIKKASEILADSLIDFRDTFNYKSFYECLKKLKNNSKGNFECFWPVIKLKAKEEKVVLDSNKEWKKASETFHLQDAEEEAFRPLLEDLGLSFVNSEIRTYYSIFTELGSRPFSIENLLDSLEAFPISVGTRLEGVKYPLNSRENIIMIYREFDLLFSRDKYKKEALINRVQKLCIGLSLYNKFHPLCNLKMANKKEIETFGFLGERTLFADNLDIPDSFLIKSISIFSPEDAIDLLSELSKDDFLEFYFNDSWKPLDTYRYFATSTSLTSKLQRKELKDKFLDIPMFRAREEFRPMRNLSLPGNFKDPLELDILIREELDGVIIDFLERTGIKELDLVTYAKIHIHYALSNQKVTPEKIRILVDELAKGFSSIRDDPVAVRNLSDCCLIECEDGEFRKGSEVYFKSPILKEVLGIGNYHKVNYPSESIPESYKEFYCSVGVNKFPQSRDIINRIKKIVAQPPTRERSKEVEAIFNYLSKSWEELGKDRDFDFRQLKDIEWLPEDNNRAKWFKPSELYTEARRYLFHTQGKFLEYKQVRRDFQAFLDLNVEPSVEQVVLHLIACSEKKISVNREVYRFLSNHSNEMCIHRLTGKKCINIENNKFVEPNKLFWQDHPFGSYRYKLDETLRPFNDFFKALSVKETAGLDDYIEVLLEISEKYGSINKKLENQTQSILHNCFVHLQKEIADRNNIESKVKRLSGKKMIPNIDQVLYLPERVFFEDKSGIKEKFDGDLDKHVILNDPETRRIIGKLGVKTLSSAINTAIYGIRGSEDDPLLTKRIGERFNSIKRIVDSKKQLSEEGWKIDLLKELEVCKVQNLEIIYSLGIFNLKSKPQEERVFYNSEERRLYVRYKQEVPFRLIAKEIAMVLNPILDLSDLAPAINEVLQSETSEDAENILDEYGFDKIESTNVEVSQPGISISLLGNSEGERANDSTQDNEYEKDKSIEKVKSDFQHPSEGIIEPSNASITDTNTEDRSEEEASVKFTTDKKSSDENKDKVGSSKAFGSMGHTADIHKTKDSGGTHKKKQSHRGKLRSYVLSPIQAEEREREELAMCSRIERDEIDRAGIQRVIKHEKENAREPNEKDHYHKGYDIESLNSKGEIDRYIEVKSTKSKWDGFEVELTHAQFEKARELGAKYFLYVVDEALSNNPQVYEINNPALRASGYLYDRPWADGELINSENSDEIESERVFITSD